MTDAVERLQRLEHQVQRTIELVGALRGENRRLTEEREGLARRLEALEAEVGELRRRDQALTALQAEHRRLTAEREQLLGQVEGILKELARIEGL